MPCHSLVTFTTHGGEQIIEEIKGVSANDIFDKICTEGARLNIEAENQFGRVKRIEIKLEHDE